MQSSGPPLTDHGMVEGLQPSACLDHVRGYVGIEAAKVAFGHYQGKVDEGVLKSSESVIHVHSCPPDCLHSPIQSQRANDEAACSDHSEHHLVAQLGPDADVVDT